MGGRRTRRPNGHRRLLEQLNLTDAQKQQARSIMQTNRESNRAQRQEMRQLNQQWRQGTLTPDRLERAKSLRAQLRASRQAERTQMMNVLTAEQKTKLQELRQQRRANHERFGRRRPALK
jgi:protein CpxP